MLFDMERARMARRSPLLMLVVVVGVLGFTLPAVASAHAASHHKKSHVLALTVRKHQRLFQRGKVRHVIPSTPVPPAIVSYTGFRCEVTVGTGSDDNTPTNITVTDSTEFYIPYSVLFSVTTSCVGKLPKHTVVSKKVVSHRVACSQFNPFNQSAPTIKGFGTSTTFANGFFSESCNTPNFS
jgi:hypothetical protein